MTIRRPGRPPGLPKTGGRKAGTPNRGTVELRERLEQAMGEEGWHPVVQLALMTKDSGLPPELKVRALAEVSAYFAAKPKHQPNIEDEATMAEAIAAARIRAAQAAGVPPGMVVQIVTGVGAAESDMGSPSPPPAEPPLPPPPEPVTPLRLQWTDVATKPQPGPGRAITQDDLGIRRERL